MTRFHSITIHPLFLVVSHDKKAVVPWFHLPLAAPRYPAASRQVGGEAADGQVTSQRAPDGGAAAQGVPWAMPNSGSH